MVDLLISVADMEYLKIFELESMDKLLSMLIADHIFEILVQVVVGFNYFNLRL